MFSLTVSTLLITVVLNKCKCMCVCWLSQRGFSWDFPWWYRSWHLGISPFDVLGWCWSRRNMHEWRGSAPDWRQNAQERRRLMLLSLQHCLSDDAAADTDDASAYVFWSLQSLLIILPLMLVTAPRWDWLFVLSLANLCWFEHCRLIADAENWWEIVKIACWLLLKYCRFLKSYQFVVKQIIYCGWNWWMPINFAFFWKNAECW